MSSELDGGRELTAKRIAPGAALVTATALLFVDVLFGGQSFFSRDITPFFFPMKHFLAESVRQGVLPLWNPWVVAGEPFFASLQPALLYPGSALFYVLDLPWSLDLAIILHFPFAGLGVYLLFRRWGLGATPSTFGAVAFMLGGTFVSLGNFPNNLQTAAWLPWLFLLWDRFLCRGALRDGLLFAMACGLAFLGGEPQLLALGLTLIFLHGLLGVERRKLSVSTQMGGFAAAGVVSLGLVAVQLLPFLEYLRHSIRTLDLDIMFSAGRSLEPAGLLMALVPSPLAAGEFGFTTRHMIPSDVPWLLSLYVGTIVAGFFALSMIGGESRRRRVFWLFAATVGIVLALGRHSPVYRFLFEWVPLIRPFRYPEKFFLVAAFAVSLLAAGGMERWLEAPRRHFRSVAIVFGALATGAASLALMLVGPASLAVFCGRWATEPLFCGDPQTASALYAGGLFAVLAVSALFLLVALAARSGWIGVPMAGVLVVIVATVDLAHANRAVNPSVERGFYHQRPWAAEVLDRPEMRAGQARYRGTPLSAAMGHSSKVQGASELSNLYLMYQTMGPNLGQVHGLPTQDGLQGIELASVSTGISFALHNSVPVGVRLLRAHAVRYYADASQPADSLHPLELHTSHPELPIRLFEVPSPVPRAYLVAAYRLEPDPVAALRAALAEDFDLHGEVVLDQEPSGEIDSAAVGRVLEAHYGTNDVSLRVMASGPMLLVLADRSFPGWVARVDARPEPVLTANGQFRAVRVPAGTSEVEFRYEPRSFRLGAAVSAVFGMSWILAIVFLSPWRRSDDGPAE